MRHEVLQFFRQLPSSEVDQFNAAFALYRRSPGKSQSTERMLNAGGYNKVNLDTLLYDLQKLHNISDLEKLPADEPEVIAETDDSQNGQSADDANNLIKAPAGDPLPEGQEPGNDSKEAFREEYPFLNDLNCPNELKILAADKITHYKAYQSAHSQLLQIEAGTLVVEEKDKTRIAAAAVRHFKANERIKQELDHYREKNEILGEHEIFAELALQREVDAMTNEELVNFVKGTPSYISKNKTQLGKAQTDARKQELQEKIDKRNAKLALVNKRLGTSAAK